MRSGWRYPFLLTLFSIHFVKALPNHRPKRLTKEDICHETNKTFEIVDSCPENDVVLQKRSEKKKCSSASPCHGEPLVYHCLRFETKLGEVCSPVRLIKGSCCVEFNRGIGRVIEDFTSSCPECPFVYNSNMAHKYHSCVKTPTTTTNNAIKSTVTETTTLSSSKSPHNENILTDVNEEVTKEIPSREGGLSSLMVFWIGLSVTCAVLLVPGACACHRLCVRGRRSLYKHPCYSIERKKILK